MAVAITAFAPSGDASAQTRVRFGVDQFVLGAQIWVAQERGMFTREGITAEIISFPFGADTLDAVLTERVDFGIGLDFASMTRLQTGQMRIISAIIEPAPGFHQLAVRGAIRAPADLAGKRIGIARGTAQHYATLRYLETAGVAANRVTVSYFTSLLELVAALRADRIDAAFLWGDGPAQATANNNDIRMMGDDAPANVRATGFLTAHVRYLQTQGPTVVAVLRALSAATDWLNANQPEAAAIVAQRARAPADAILRLIPRQNFTISLKSTQIASFQALITFANEAGITRNLGQPMSLIDPSFLRTAAPQQVSLSP